MEHVRELTFDISVGHVHHSPLRFFLKTFVLREQGEGFDALEQGKGGMMDFVIRNGVGRDYPRERGYVLLQVAYARFWRTVLNFRQRHRCHTWSNRYL